MSSLIKLRCMQHARIALDRPGSTFFELCRTKAKEVLSLLNESVEPKPNKRSPKATRLLASTKAELVAFIQEEEESSSEDEDVTTDLFEFSGSLSLPFPPLSFYLPLSSYLHSPPYPHTGILNRQQVGCIFEYYVSWVCQPLPTWETRLTFSDHEALDAYDKKYEKFQAAKLRQARRRAYGYQMEGKKKKMKTVKKKVERGEGGGSDCAN